MKEIKKFYYGCESAAEAMYKVEVYSTCPYRVLEIHYFESASEGQEYADNYFDAHGYDGHVDYEGEYREYSKGPWIAEQY